MDGDMYGNGNRHWEQRKWNAPYAEYGGEHSMLQQPEFDFDGFNIPRANVDLSLPEPQFRSPMADCDYGDNYGSDQRKRRMPYRGPAPHRNPAPGPMGLTGPWQEGGGGPRPPVFNRRGGRGGFGRGSTMPRDQHMMPRDQQRPPAFQGNPGGPPQPIRDFPKNKKPNPYNMAINPTGKVDVGAAKQKLLESVLQCKDMALPKELLEKFSPLKCDLCNAKMNSTSMAKLHYSGKNHEKKVRQYMNNLNGVDGNAVVPKKAKLDTPANPIIITANLKVDESIANETENVQAMEADPSPAVIQSQKMECISCNVSFTSPVQASQHFMSKNHARKLKGLDPKNAKYYNMETAEWQAKPVPSLPEDKTGRFGIGVEFLNNEEPEVPVVKINPEINKSLKVYCDVCDCYTTSQEQMQAHLKGSRHQKKLAAKERAQSNLPQGIFLEEPAPAPVTVPTDPKKGAVKPTASDLANFRTPSGLFYCSTCNISVNSESQFKTHSESKKHKSKASMAKNTQQAPAKGEQWKAAVPANDVELPANTGFGLIPSETEPTS